MPPEAGIQSSVNPYNFKILDSRFRGNDSDFRKCDTVAIEKGYFATREV
jgi:hypothetical protein